MVLILITVNSSSYIMIGRYLIASRGWNLYHAFRLAHSSDNIFRWLPEEK